MERYLPDIYSKTIYDINYKNLKERGITFLIFELNNTIASKKIKKPSWKMKKLIKQLKDDGFNLIIITNAGKRRIKSFEEEFDIDCLTRAAKPKIKNFVKIMKYYNLEEPQVASIGSNLSVDTYVGNKMGITTILVDPIDNSESTFNLKLMKEQKIKNSLFKLDLFRSGKYYE